MNSIDPRLAILVEALETIKLAGGELERNVAIEALEATRKLPTEIAKRDKAWWLNWASTATMSPSMNETAALIASTMADKPKEEL